MCSDARIVASATEGAAPAQGARSLPIWRYASDPRVAIAAILAGYLVLGFTVLGFNRGPLQALVTSASACALEVLLARLFRNRWVVPLSALITSLSLTILLNYAHDYSVLVVPVFFAIASKYVFTFEDRHTLNPALAGVCFSLIFAGELITAAPAYQWNGIAAMSVFMVMLALIFIMPRIRRGALVASFLLTFTALTALRALIMRWHLPFETLFWGTLSSPAFFLFTFFMITDPATSPSDRRGQIVTGVALAVIDVLLHIRQSYFTFFYAAFILGFAKLGYLHFVAIRADEAGAWAYLRRKMLSGRHLRRLVVLAALAGAGMLAHRTLISPRLSISQLPFSLEKISASRSGIEPQMGDALDRIDPRLSHVAKWLFSVGDAVAVGDYDNDGLLDLFFTFPLKRDADRAALYRNLGDFRFTRVPVPALERRNREIESHGLPSAAAFVDYDGDGDDDLYIAYASGRSVLLRNARDSEGQVRFEDIAAEVGIDSFGNPMAVNFADFNRDGRLDLFVGNVLPTHLQGYATPPELNLFRLPDPAHDQDERMFDFMHASWHMADNGGANDLYLQTADARFKPVDRKAFGLEHTGWSLSLGVSDFNRDGFPDVYVANDFGPDQLLLNQGGARFSAVVADAFGAIGRDTYKGMNASVSDVDNDGFADVYVSNVHHALQAEGSLLWRFSAGDVEGVPTVEDVATRMGALNPSRFGWGAAFGDLDRDGFADIVQANGMVDDLVDRRFESCPDYWYVNEKIARSPPSIHTFANKWGDIRGFCIYPNELDRVLLNRKGPRGRLFVDAAEQVGLVEKANSRGVAVADLDNDGALDIVITHQFRPPSIYRNVRSPDDTSHFIGIELQAQTEACRGPAVGSRVEIIAPRRGVRWDERRVVNGFGGQGDPRLFFGLASDDRPVDVQVTWCGGPTKTEHRSLAVDRVHRLRLD